MPQTIAFLHLKHLGYLVRDLKSLITSFTFPDSVVTDTCLKHLGEKCAQNSVKLQDYDTGWSPFSYTLLLFELNTAYYVSGLFWLFATIVLMMIYTYYFCGSEDIVLLLESEYEVWKGDCLKCYFYATVCLSGNRKDLDYLPAVFCYSPWKKEEGSMVCVLCNHSLF